MEGCYHKEDKVFQKKWPFKNFFEVLTAIFFLVDCNIRDKRVQSFRIYLTILTVPSSLVDLLLSLKCHGHVYVYIHAFKKCLHIL